MIKNKKNTLQQSAALLLNIASIYVLVGAAPVFAKMKKVSRNLAKYYERSYKAFTDMGFQDKFTEDFKTICEGIKNDKWEYPEEVLHECIYQSRVAGTTKAETSS